MPGPELPRGFAAQLIRWQRRHGRHALPWQGQREPYLVWLSEIMLQQTQVATVLDYYPRFLQRFPSLAALAAAPLDDVLALWSGLGYYSRARNLHRCAQEVVAQHGGQFPASSQALAQLPGIGRSTAAAIAAFCFGERAAILDGNVKRVLSRVLAFGDALARASAERALWAHAQALLPERGIEAYTQGLMDLGATVCSVRRPACDACPVAQHCAAHASGRQEAFPVKSRRLKRSARSNALLWLQQGGLVWLVQRPPRGVWAGLWSLPEYDTPDALEAQAAAWPGHGQWLAPIETALTHFDWRLHTLAWALPVGVAESGTEPGMPAGLAEGRWLSVEQALALGLPAPVRKLLQAGR